MKWAAVVLSATLLVITLLLVHGRRTAPGAAALEIGNPVIAR